MSKNLSNVSLNMTQKWPKFFSNNFTPTYSQTSLVCKHRRTSHNDVVRPVALSLVKTSRSSFDIYHIFLSIISFILKIQWKVIYWSVSFKWPTVMAERNHKSPKAKKCLFVRDFLPIKSKFPLLKKQHWGLKAHSSLGTICLFCENNCPVCFQ